MARYLIDVDYNPPGFQPYTVSVRKVNIDPAGYPLTSDSSDSLSRLLGKMGRIIAESERAYGPICARCRKPLENMRKVVESKDGALFHGRCWGK